MGIFERQPQKSEGERFVEFCKVMEPRVATIGAARGKTNDHGAEVIDTLANKFKMKAEKIKDGDIEKAFDSLTF